MCSFTTVASRFPVDILAQHCEERHRSGCVFREHMDFLSARRPLNHPVAQENAPVLVTRYCASNTPILKNYMGIEISKTEW